MKVLVTNAELKHSLAAIRSLGKAGMEVFSVSEFKYAQGFFSKYSRKHYRCPPPVSYEDYVDFLADVGEKEGIDVILPIGFVSILALSKLADRIKGPRMPLHDHAAILRASNKWDMFEQAVKVGVPVPKTVRMDDISGNIGIDMRFPVVVKGDEGTGFVAYCNSVKEVRERQAQLKTFYEHHYLGKGSMVLQEFIPGDGYGFFALFNHGEPRATFQHRRIREFPVTGGVSSKAMSVRDTELEALGLRLLRSMKWHGVAMVEFKKDRRDDKYKLIEVNPKFWGSLALAIKSGVDFPCLAAEMAYRGDIEPVRGYSVGTTYRWLLPEDLLHVLSNPKALPVFIKDSLDPRIGSDISLSDPLPTIAQIGTTLLQLKRVMGHRERRLPRKWREP